MVSLSVYRCYEDFETMVLNFSGEIENNAKHHCATNDR